MVSAIEEGGVTKIYVENIAKYHILASVMPSYEEEGGNQEGQIVPWIK